MAESRRYFSEIMNPNGGNTMDTEEEDEEKAMLYKEPMRRNLLEVFEKSVPVEVSDERMSVFLRIRPFSEEENDSKENQGCVEVQNNFMVKANAPKESHTYRSQLYGLNKASHTFTFSRVFSEATTQKELFDSTMLKLVQDFIEGQNCLVFTYGVTNSGKTYTIQGNPKEAGVLPRGLDVLFNSINGKQWPGMGLKPRMFCDVVKLSAAEEEAEQKIKENTLKLNSSEDHDVMTLLGDDASDQSVMNGTAQSDSSVMADMKPGLRESQESLIGDLENRDREETAVDVAVQGQIRFSVWVSFAEIYNEQIFDLLEPMPKKKDAKRPVLKLSDDRRGSPYIKGLKEINVTSADEAYKLLTIGQRNLKTACTRLNHCSSRSHCIFNVKIIRVPDKGDPKMARVSMLSLCDLAGSERHSKTHTTGDRLKEAGNINTSLLTLGRCIELLRYNQHHKDKEKIIPFRESRLTRLFQNFFCGRGKAAMIVNVSQCASMFDETLNVFKFSAIAKQVVMPPKPVEKPAELKRKRQTKSTRASSICWDTSATPSRTNQASQMTAEAMVEEEESDDDTAYIEQLEQHVEALEGRIKTMRRERLLREHEIRKEVCREMQDQFVQIEDMYSNMLQQTRQAEEEKFEQKLQIIMDYNDVVPAKRRRLDNTASTSQNIMVDSDDEWVSSLLLHQEKVKVKEREESLAQLQKQTTELEFQVSDLTRKNRDLQNVSSSAGDTRSKLESQVAELTQRNSELESKLAQAKEAHRKLEQGCAEKVAQAEAVKNAAVSEASKSSDDCVLLETLGRQLQEAKDRLKHQEVEIRDLNEMLTDAGDTFHQKEEEISKLKQAIADDEIKAQQQMETIRELQALLVESKTAVEESERQLEAKNVTLGEMKEELAQLEVRLKDRRGADPSDALRKAEEELAIARSRLKHEEEDFQQRHKALIHGYTAEINNLKSQMALLKSRNLGRCVATSPMKIATPEKARSPLKHRRKGHGDKQKEGEGSTVDLVAHLKHLRTQLSQTNSLTPETRHGLREAWQAAELLQQQVAQREEVECRLEQSATDLQDLQGKFQELSAASTELRRQLDSKKELHTELTDNQSESAELRQKLRIAQSSADDLEGRLAAASQQAITAEAGKAKVMTELTEVKATLTQLEAHRKDSDCEVSDLQRTVTSTTQRNAELQKEVDSYKVTLEAINAKMVAASEARQDVEDKVASLKGEVSDHQAQAVRDREKKEELEMVVRELRAMLDQASGQLECKVKASGQLESMAKASGQLESKAKASEDRVKPSMAACNETLLKEALSEANQVLQQRTEQCEYFNTQLAEGRATITELESQLASEQATIAELESQLASEQATIAELRTSMLEKDVREKELRETMTRQTQDLADKGAQCEQLQQQGAQSQQLLTDRQCEVEALAASCKVAEEALSQHKVQSAADHQIHDLKARCQAAQEALAQQEKVQSKLQEELGSTKQALEDLKLKESATQAGLDSTKGALEDLTLKESATQAELDSTKQALEDLKLKESATQAELDSTKQALEDLKLKESATQAGLDSTKGALEDLTLKESATQAELDSTKQALEDLKLKESATQAELDSTKQALEDLKLKESATQAELDSTKQTLEDLKLKESATQAELDFTKQALEDLKLKESATQAELDSTKQALENLRLKETATQAELESTKGALENLRLKESATQADLDSTKQALKDLKLKEAATQADLESTQQVLEELTQKECGRLQNMKSLEKAQKEARRLQEKKLAEAREALQARSTEVEALKEALAQLQQAGAEEAESELAQLRSSLHMQEALTEKHRDAANTLTQQSALLEQRLKSVDLDLEKLLKEKQNMMEEMSILKAKVSEADDAGRQKADRLDQELAELRVAMDTLTAELEQSQQSARERLETCEEKARVERASLESRLQQLEAEEKDWKESLQAAQTQLEAARAAAREPKPSVTTAEHGTSTSPAKLEAQSGDRDTDMAALETDQSKVSELQRQLKTATTAPGTQGLPGLESDLQAERSLREDLHKRLKMALSIDPAVEAPGTSRRLRKEKIQAESNLALARFETEKLQRRVEELLNAKDTGATPSVSWQGCPHCRHSALTSKSLDSSVMEKLGRDLTEKCRQLQEVETVLQRCECELLEVKAKLANAETELKEVRGQEMRSRKEADSRQGNSVGNSETYRTLQSELDKSQEREGRLRRELQSCAQLVAADTNVTQLQQQLDLKTAELDKALRREQEKSAESSREEELSQQVATLTAQLKSQSQQLQDKTQRLADLQADLSHATKQRNIAIADVKANEQVLQQLKDAMLDQEETMEKQDAVISRRDDEIRSLNAELDRLNDRCQQLLSHDTDSSREVRTLTQVNVRLEEEKKLLARDMEELQGKLKQALTDKDAAQEQLTQKDRELRGVRQAAVTEDNAVHALQTQLSGALTDLSKVKKACEKDTALYMEKENKLKHTVQTLGDKIKKQDEDKKVWREERDKLVGQMEALLSQQSAENSSLKTQWEEDQSRYEKQLEQSRQEVHELKRELKMVTRAKDSLLTDMRHSNHQLQVELAIAQGTEPPPRPPPPQHQSFRINDSELVDDVDTTGHIEVDATPAVAAKNLRKGRKRSSTLNTSSDSSAGGRKQRRRPRKQVDENLDTVQEAPELCNKMTAHLQELEERGSPLTRSAKKILHLISPERKTKGGVGGDQDDTTPAPSHDNTATNTNNKRGRGKRSTQDKLPAPFDCAPFQLPDMETRKSSRLRTRGQKSRQQSVV